jgi:hypothetical protein
MYELVSNPFQICRLAVLKKYSPDPEISFDEASSGFSELASLKPELASLVIWSARLMRSNRLL